MTETANPRFLQPLSAPEADTGKVAHFGPDKPLKLDCGRTLSPFDIAYMTYGRLNAAKSNAILICHALTGDQFVASESRHRQARLVEPDGRAGQAHRHRPFLRHLRQCHWRLHGLDGAGGKRSRHRKALWPELPPCHREGHGPCPGHAARHAGYRKTADGHGWFDGRHAGAAMGGVVPQACARRHADRLRRAPLGAEYRLPRSGAPGDHGRSRLERRRISTARHPPVQGPGGGAHGRAYHLSFGSGASAEIRPQSPEPRCPVVSVCTRFPDRDPICVIKA